MYEVPHAGPPRRPWQWWVVTAWIIVLSSGLVFYVLDRLLDGMDHPTEGILVTMSGFLAGYLLRMAAQRARQAPGTDAESGAVWQLSRAGWVNLIACTGWAILVLAWYLRTPG